MIRSPWYALKVCSDFAWKFWGKPGKPHSVYEYVSAPAEVPISILTEHKTGPSHYTLVFGAHRLWCG